MKCLSRRSILHDTSIATAEIRRRAIDAYKMGKGSQADIASSYRVDLRTFQRGLSRFNETGQTAPRPRGHRQALYSGKQLKALPGGCKSLEKAVDPRGGQT
ncbi:MAG: helix-turn-helix domain-containing protein [Kiritimatiellae bacterium]|nr:helix-turn-helix domain-containing protein [Kiritimatiellia bacterium]NKB25506.1 helix-turn-helix domain-containing protein [Kiritimatiellia bacterium]